MTALLSLAGVRAELVRLPPVKLRVVVDNGTEVLLDPMDRMPDGRLLAAQVVTLWKREAKRTGVEVARLVISFLGRLPPRPCRYCGQLFPSYLPSQRYCCLKHYWLALDNPQRAPRAVRRIEWRDIFDRDDGICWICMEPVFRTGTGAQAPSVDHVVAKSLGGEDTMDNVRLAHSMCNTKRGNSEA